jgi:nucleoside-diphosphate-sugar epimerase
MTNILITGGAGFIGSSLADRLLQDGNYSVVCVDNLLTGSGVNVPQHPACRFVKCDVNNFDELSQVMRSNKFDYVFHYAAVVGVKRTIDNPVMVLEDIQGIKGVLDLCRETRVKRVFYSSSSEVYGEPVELPQHEETTPLNSRLPYAVVKNVGESFCKAYQKAFGLDFTIFRFFNTYGPRQSADFVVSKFLEAAINNEPLTIYGKGDQTRTFCYIDDNTDCTLEILTRNSHINDVINIGSEVSISVLHLAETIIMQTGSKSRIQFLPPLKEGDMTRRQPDASKMNSILSRPPVSLKAGLDLILAAIREQAGVQTKTL